MSFNPYVAQRSTTPPLYYRRPEGVAPSYYMPTAAPEVSSLSIPSYPTPRASAAGAEERPANAAASAARPVPVYAPYVTNPFGPAAMPPPPPVQARDSSDMRFRPSDSAAYGAGPLPPPPATSAAHGRWAYPQMQRAEEESRHAAQMDAEEAALVAEEAALRARKTELLVNRRRQEEEQLRLSEGWATLAEREERYYTEPVPDYSQDIAAREHQCAALHDQLQQTEAQRSYFEKQLENYDFVLKDKVSLEGQMQQMHEELQGVEKRRRACVAVAERFFDAETKRVAEANRAVRKLDVQIQDLTSSGPLAQLQVGGSSSRSQSRCVNFAPADKSVIIDIGRNGSLSTSVSAEPAGRRDGAQGLSEEDTESSGHTFNSARAAGARGLGGGSLCLALDDDEEGSLGGIGGASIAFSMNNSATDAFSKRQKLELVA